MPIALRSLTLGLLLVHGCGGSSSGAAPTRTPEPTIPTAPERGPTQPISAGKGSSDGTTCEQARESYTEEVSIGARGQADLSADDFAAVLNRGSYLEPCAVPSSSKLRICAAVQNGQAVGVTVAAEPSAPDVEVCIAKEVRKLSFPAHAKMDVVSVQF
jgi:eukaryotic-like serine/threonine-protein kinase